MADSQREYPAEFREKLVDLVRSGRSTESLAQEFDLPVKTIRNWVRADNEDIRRLRKEKRQLLKKKRRLEMELEILKKADAWFSRDTDSTSSGSSSS